MDLENVNYVLISSKDLIKFLKYFDEWLINHRNWFEDWLYPNDVVANNNGNEGTNKVIKDEDKQKIEKSLISFGFLENFK